MLEPYENLQPARIRAGLIRQLGQRLAGRFDVRVVSETGSTNDDVLRFGETGSSEGLVLFTESQTSGRGRRANAARYKPVTRCSAGVLSPARRAARPVLEASFALISLELIRCRLCARLEDWMRSHSQTLALAGLPKTRRKADDLL